MFFATWLPLLVLRGNPLICRRNTELLHHGPETLAPDPPLTAAEHEALATGWSWHYQRQPVGPVRVWRDATGRIRGLQEP